MCGPRLVEWERSEMIPREGLQGEERGERSESVGAHAKCTPSDDLGDLLTCVLL